MRLTVSTESRMSLGSEYVRYLVLEVEEWHEGKHSGGGGGLFDRSV